MKYKNRPQSRNIEDRRREHKIDVNRDKIVETIRKVDQYASNLKAKAERKSSISKSLTAQADAIMRGIDPKVLKNKRNKRRDSLNG